MSKLNKKLITTVITTALLFYQSSQVFAIKTDASITRLGGQNRYETAIEISKEFEKDDTITSCIIGRDDDFADSISVTAFSAYKNAPILLTQKGSLNTETKARLAEMPVRNIYIVGGTGVISTNVENELKSLAYIVTRYGGADRVATNRLIMAAIPKELWGPNPKVINSEDWVQGMSIAMDTKAYVGGVTYFNPIFVTNSSTGSPEDLKDVVAALAPAKATWETRNKDKYKVMLDSNIFANAWNRIPNEYKESASRTDTTIDARNLEYQQGVNNAITAPFGKTGGIDSGFSKSTTIANLNIIRDYSDLIMHDTGVPYQVYATLLVRGDNFIDSLAVSTLSAKKRMPIVMANVSASTVLGRTVTADDKKNYFTNIFDNINKVYYVGGQSAVPDGSESFLRGN